MLVKIPLLYYKVQNAEIDWEALGIEEPEQELEKDELVEYDTYIDPNEVVWIEPNISGEGCCIHVKGMDREWLSPLDVEEAAKKINEAARK